MSRNEHDENLETVRRIARHLDELAEGERHIKCPKCSGVDTIIENETAGDNETVPEDEREYYETIEEYAECYPWQCSECGARFDEAPEDDDEPQDLYSYFEDVLDIEYRISGQGDYLGAILTIACGGPHIDVDTRERAVKLWWGGDKAEWSISSDTADAIDEIFEEYYNCLK